MNIFKISCVIIATLMGAGFATGQEIMQFFNRFSFCGFYGIILMGIIMTIITIFSLEIIRRNNINNLDDFITSLTSCNFLQKILKVFNTIILFLFFIVMIAGAGTFFEEYFGLNFFIGGGIFVLLCYFIFNKSVNMVIAINDILAPLMIIGILGLCFSVINVDTAGLKRIYLDNNMLIDKDWAISAILYTSYNMVSIISVLTTMKKVINSKKTIILGSIISGVVVVMLEILIFYLISTNYTLVSSSEMPILKIINQYDLFLVGVYNLILILSIFTTAINIGYSFLLKISKSKEEYRKMSFCFCFISLFLASYGFSNLVKIIYPIIGIIGILEILLIIYTFVGIKSKKLLKNYLGE